MRTTKPISTISFNSREFLKMKLDELTKVGKIAFWAFIVHKPEDDEGGKKEHMHLYLEPSAMLQTEELRKEFREIDLEKPDKTRGCLTFNSSRFDPWYLYILHDKAYLASKGQSRKFHYSHGDIVSSDADDLLFKAKSIDLLSLSPYAPMQDAINHGFNWDEYFARGTVPMNLVKQAKEAWESLMRSYTMRNGYENHANDYEED